MAKPDAGLARITERVKAMRRGGESLNAIARTLGVNRRTVRTILAKGAHHTRGATRRRILRWGGIASGSGPSGAAQTGAAAAPVRPGRRRRGRPAGRGRRAGRARLGSRGRPGQRGAPARRGRPPIGPHALLELDNGQVVRLSAGARYVMRGGILYQAVESS